MFSKNLSLVVLECAVVYTLAFSSLISIVHASEEEPTEEPNPDEEAISLFGSLTSVIMTDPSTSHTSLVTKSSSKNAMKTSFHHMDKHSQDLMSPSNAGVFTSRHKVATHSMPLDVASIPVESSHSTVELSSLPASHGEFLSVDVTGTHHVQTGIVLSHVQSLPVVSEATQSQKTTGLLWHSQYQTVVLNETHHLHKSIQSSHMQSLSVGTSGLSWHSQDPFVFPNKTHYFQTSIPSRHMQSVQSALTETLPGQTSIPPRHMQSEPLALTGTLPGQTSIPSRHMQSEPLALTETLPGQTSIPSRHMQSEQPALTETLPGQTSSLSRHSENLASRQTHNLQAGISTASITITSQVPVLSSISSIISSPSLSEGRDKILNFTTAFSRTFPLPRTSSSATSHLIEGTGYSTKRLSMLQQSVQSSVVIQSALVGSVGISSVVGSRTTMASEPHSKTIGHTITAFQGGSYSSSWYQSSSVLPLPFPQPLDPPSVQEATALSADSVYLKWNASHFQVVSNFTVELSVNSFTWEKVACKKSLVEEKCVVTQKSAVVVGLQPYTNYTFRVFATSQFGRSNASEGNIWVTTNESVPSHPAQVMVQAVNSTVIFVNWTEPTEMNGLLVKYEVKYSEKVSSEAVVVSTLRKSLLLFPLKPYTVYVINVSAFTHAGEGRRITVLEKTAEAEPTGAPQHVLAVTLASTSILMTWDSPLKSEQNGVITLYTVQYTSQSSGEIKRLNTTGNSTSLEVNNLASYTTYSLSIKAWNAVGSGPWSEPVENTTFESRPSSPRNLSAKSINSTAVKVTWISSQNPNGEIQYRLFYWQSSEGPGAKRQAYDGPALEHVIAGLHEFVAYTFTLLAYNVKYSWSSPVVNSTETTHPEEPAGPPVNVTALANSSTSILVRWSPPRELDRNGIIISYIVNYNLSQGHQGSINITGNRTEKLVSNLGKYSAHYFTVQAVNNIGVGPASQPVFSRTFEDVPGTPVIKHVEHTSTSLVVTWDPPAEPNGVIESFTLCWNLEIFNNRSCVLLLATYNLYNISILRAPIEASVICSNYISATDSVVTADSSGKCFFPAEPYSSYKVSLSASTSVGLGAVVSGIYRTDEGVPGAPVIKNVEHTSTSLAVTWEPPTEPNGIIVFFYVCWNLEILNNRSCVRLPVTDNLYNISNLRAPIEASVICSNYISATDSVVTADSSGECFFPAEPYSSYKVSLSASTSVGLGAVVSGIYRTDEGVPGAPVIKHVEHTSTSLAVTWDHPTEPNGVIESLTLCWNLEMSNNRSCVPLPATDNLYNISNLKPYSSYKVSLSARTSVGLGAVVSGIYRTDEGVPSEPRQFQAWNTSETSVFVIWKEPANMNGVLERYKVFFKEAGAGESSTKNAGVSNNMSLTQLKPYTQYYITVQAFTSKGGGGESMVHVMTDETVPSGVTDISFINPTSNSVKVIWKPPVKLNGKIGYYLLYWRTSVADSVIGRWMFSGGVTSKLVTGLKPYVHYTFSVIPYNLRKSLHGPPSNNSITTEAAAPSGPPLNVKIDNTTSSSITLSWDPPLEPNGEIVGYEVTYYESDPDKKNVHDNVKGQVYTLTGLEPWKTYYVAVACQSTGGIGQHSDWIPKRTDAGAPPPIGTLAPPEEQKITSTTFEVELTKASNENGDVRYYQVIVRELAKDNKGNPVPPYDPDSYKTEDLYTYDEARRMKPKLVPYIAFQFSASDFDRFKRFTVGDGKGSFDTELKSFLRRRRRSNGGSVYYNGPLEEQTLYTVFQRAYVNKDVYASSSWIDAIATESAPATSHPATRGVSSSTKVGLIVGLVFAILIVLVLILVGIVFIRKKRLEFGSVLDDRDDYSNGQPMRMRASRKRRSLQKRLMGSTDSLDALDELAANRAKRQPVPIDDFERHVDRMHMDGDHGFSEEYTLVQPEEDFSFQQFLNPANKYKNRYANIVAYDHTRVLLNPVEGVAGSDYINANFIDGYNRPRAFIAAQGPLMETFDDFWRMIWEQRTLVIVMLTKLEERGRKKCDKYWPDRGAKTYGQVQVKLKETLNMSYYTVRKMTVTHKQFPDEERAIKQFHFTAWPDHGVPSHPTPLLSLVRHVSTSSRDAYGPMVVHCSAGVGRTGTFITLDVMLQKISDEDCIDVFAFVRQMRYQRNYMVQTEAQYVFIHDALLEAIACGVTEVEAKDLSTRLRELRQVDAENGYTNLENEFCRLAKEENHPIAFKSASLNCNTGKNRYANILPFESTRVHLKMRPGEMGSDYINANYIDGYCQPKAYIATQAPVPDTFEDFWRLIWEHESAAIVMLTMEEERGKIKCHRYWPSDGGSRLYGVILVELVEEESYSDYITRKFKLTHTEEKDSRTIRQFQYTDWPDSALPDSGVGIIDLIGQVQKWQQQSGNTAIVIHCSGGVGRTGVFCAISIMIERLKAEGVVDVFQTVQAMRLQRPAMVQTAEQYEFCYTTLQEYLDSFDLYANFQ